MSFCAHIVASCFCAHTVASCVLTRSHHVCVLTRSHHVCVLTQSHHVCLLTQSHHVSVLTRSHHVCVLTQSHHFCVLTQSHHVCFTIDPRHQTVVRIRDSTQCSNCPEWRGVRQLQPTNFLSGVLENGGSVESGMKTWGSEPPALPAIRALILRVFSLQENTLNLPRLRNPTFSTNVYTSVNIYILYKIYDSSDVCYFFSKVITCLFYNIPYWNLLQRIYNWIAFIMMLLLSWWRRPAFLCVMYDGRWRRLSSKLHEIGNPWFLQSCLMLVVSYA